MVAAHVLEIRNLSKTFRSEDGPVTAVDDISFTVRGDEFFTMLGPSGCGKTTTLRMIAGLESVTSGAVLFDGVDFTRYSFFRRNIGMVFQSYALFPHLTVFENAAYGLRVRKLSGDVIKRKVDQILRFLGLQSLAGRYPSDLSGGQQQRVSIARALAYDPGMLLLDEPLANLDAKLRVEMREEIRRIQKELGIMSIYVTHDQEEAMSVSDRLAVFNKGRLMQAGDPEEIYGQPMSLFVADFIGKANFFPARVELLNGTRARAATRGGVSVAAERVVTLESEDDIAIPADFDSMIMVRPEHIELLSPTASEAFGGGLPCTVRRAQYLGSFVRYMAECPDAIREVVIDTRRPVADLHEGAAATLSIPAADAHLFRQGSSR